MVTDLSTFAHSGVSEISNVTIVTFADNHQVFGVFALPGYDAAGRTATC
jgi:hydroxymethylpyrimidine/phosphomethylpyrimidine kinase